MFSKEDYVKYFLQIRKVENTMHERFGTYAEAVDDPQLKKFFLALQRQEKAHARIVDGMLETFGYKDK
ncbi:MAG: hypothetical protein A2X35_02430 [Elusimicrobia bacterium GWA2_61_42]|nr:MAG: hypothetical protein A2X35_02430 [Elusimicrobia bacterium GWA2_61_42]OGR75122.1 MAG: hypothetical protein A2X38_06310 [Elusimicrobia bacterium GWC2_61_25]